MKKILPKRPVSQGADIGAAALSPAYLVGATQGSSLGWSGASER